MRITPDVESIRRNVQELLDAGFEVPEYLRSLLVKSSFLQKNEAVIRMRFHEELPFSVIGRALGMSPKGVYTIVYEFRVWMREVAPGVPLNEVVLPGGRPLARNWLQKVEELLRLRYRDELSYGTIAGKLQVSRQSVHKVIKGFEEWLQSRAST